jgi:hypothetical protein
MRSPLPFRLGLLLLSACSSHWTAVDIDGDGYTVAQGDCWDNEAGPDGQASADIHPGATETWYDGFDQDCSGGSDFDKDGDGHAAVDFPDPEGLLPADDCWDDPDVVPDGFAALDPSLQPSAADVYPGAAEAWYDGVDGDCGGGDDFDQDGDGFDSAIHADADGTTGDDCFDAVDDGFVNDGGLDPADVNPDAADDWYDGTDADCAGDDDFDQDGDGYPVSAECDDLDPQRYPDPDVVEIWYDGVDQNCDGNDGDQDGDGYYVADYSGEIPEGYLPGDCWDDPALGALWEPINGFDPLAPAQVHPGAEETWYDGVDQDCDGGGDFDQDADGYDTDTYAAAGGLFGDDCDDTSAAVNPDAVETWYDGVDANCAGDDDFDQDADGHASTDGGGDDCADTDATIHPGVPEVCGNSVDEDCSSSLNDEGATGCSDFYADSDTDGFGSTDSACLCEAEGIYTATVSTDCDDGDGTVNPDGVESCLTTADDDCSGSTNAVGAAGCTQFYIDGDSDDYGTGGGRCACRGAGAYTAENADDCDDGDEAINPAAAETCNDADDNCDGVADDGLALYYDDADGDSYGAGTGDCATGGGRVSNGSDCDDGADTVYPGATELCDGVANDCTTASGWTSASEDLKVSYVSDAGAWSDLSSTFAGTSTVTYSLSSTGTYYFCAGTYHAKLLGSGDTVDVIGVYGAADTVLQSTTTAGSTVSVTNGSITLSGFTISGGKGSGTTTTYGGGVLASATGTALTAPNLTLEDCVLTGNTATRGGGISAYGLGWASLVRTTVESNTATDGAGIYASTSARVSLEDAEVYDNTASGDGGGIFLDDGTLAMTGTAVFSNSAGDDAGGLYIDTGTATCGGTGGGIYANTAADHGGGVYLATANYGSFTSTGCDFGTGALDNSTSDVTVKGTGYTSYTAYTSSASFVCTGISGICTP